MERETVVLDLQKEANYVANLFAGDLQGYQLDFPTYRLIFNTQVQDYLPGIVVRASQNDSEKFLVSSPLANQLLLVEDGTFLEITDFEKKYKKGCLASEFVKDDDGEWALKISLVNPEKLCPTVEKAAEIVDAFIVMTYEEDVREKFYQLERQNIVFKPCLTVGELCWGLELTQNRKTQRIKLLLADVANSSVNTMDLPISEYKEIEYGARFKTNAIPSCPSKNYFFNGRKFRPVEDDSQFMTIEEAKEVYENMPQSFKDQYKNYEDENYAPAICCHYDLSYVISANYRADPPSLLIIDSQIGFITDFNVNIDKTVLFQVVGLTFADGEKQAILTEKGWISCGNKK